MTKAERSSTGDTPTAQTPHTPPVGDEGTAADSAVKTAEAPGADNTAEQESSRPYYMPTLTWGERLDLSAKQWWPLIGVVIAVSYTHLTLPTKSDECRSRWSPYQ